MNDTTRILYVISAWQPACPLEMIYEGMKAKTAIQAATGDSDSRSAREYRVSDPETRTRTNRLGCVNRPRERTATRSGKGDAAQMIAKTVYDPKYIFREGVEPVAYQVWKSEASEIIHASCATDPNDREFPLYADDIEAARYLEPIICLKCDMMIADSKEIF